MKYLKLPIDSDNLPIGEDRMSNYRAYLLGRDGHIARRVDLDCGDDEAAKRGANALVGAYDIELWDGARKVAEFRRRTIERSLQSNGCGARLAVANLEMRSDEVS